MISLVVLGSMALVIGTMGADSRRASLRTDLRHAEHRIRLCPTGRPDVRRLRSSIPTIQPAVRALIGLQPARGSEQVGGATVRALRWALGSSPSWHLALVRSGAPVPPGLFRQPLPAQHPASRATGRRKPAPQARAGRLAQPMFAKMQSEPGRICPSGVLSLHRWTEGIQLISAKLCL